MVLILTSPGDLSTDLVIDWLRFYKHPFYRLNSSDLIEKQFFYDINNRIITIDNQILELDKINIIWYRKFAFFSNSEFHEKAQNIIDLNYLDLLSIEFSTILRTFSASISEKKWLTNPKNIYLNKVEVLQKAKEEGLDIPASFLVNRKNDLEKIDKQLITKSIFEAAFLKEPDGLYSMLTKEIFKESIYTEVPSEFFTSLVQETIDKEYELRVFLLDNKFYSMAIFSQLDERTKVDFRNYNHEKPNQNVPYQLPKKIERKLLNLTKRLGLNCCSIDIIKGKNGVYYFLEINPVGQFGMVSIPCNYHLHEKVAKHLIKQDKKNE